jgi:hypothetical protein
MKYEFMFLCLAIPGPDHPGPKLNVMLKPLINELKELSNGVEAYYSHKKQKFTLRAAYLWSVHDFMAYVIFVGWSVHGRFYVDLILIVSALLLVGRLATLILIDVGCH